MVNYGMGQRPTIIYALVSGSGTSSANLKVEQTDGDWIPLQVSDDGKLKVDASLVLSGTTISVNLNQSDDDILIYGNDGSANRKINTDTTGKIELGSATLAALETVTAIVSGSMSVDLSYIDDSILMYGSDGTSRPIKTDNVGAIELGSKTLTSLISGSKAATGSYNQVVVGTSATSIIAANPSRKYLIVENHNIEDIFLGLSAAVLTTTGMKIVKGGEPFSSTVYTGGIWGIVTSGTSVASYVEF